MKIQRKSSPNKDLTPDSQKRLVAYTTAASLGALFTGQSAKAQVVESAALAPYPATLPAAAGTNTTDFPFSVDGVSNEFEFIVFGQSNVITRPWLNVNQLVDIHGFTTNSIGTNTVLNNLVMDSNVTHHAYCLATYGGLVIGATNAAPQSYKPRLAISYNYVSYGIYTDLLDNKFREPGALGFEFVSGLDGQLHFGYMDVMVNSETLTNASTGKFNYIITSLTVYGVYYNQTPNAPVTIPNEVVVTNFTLGPTNQVTINFSCNTNAPASAFTLLTSPTLGPSATWTPVPAVITPIGLPQNVGLGYPLGYFQAVTNASGGPSQFYRIQQN